MVAHVDTVVGQKLGADEVPTLNSYLTKIDGIANVWGSLE